MIQELLNLSEYNNQFNKSNNFNNLLKIPNKNSLNLKKSRKKTFLSFNPNYQLLETRP
jgi:hypothetical protein